VTLPDAVHAPGVTAPTVAMSDTGPQDTCQGKTVPISYGGSFTGSFQVGSVATPFTVTIGPSTGGPLYPTARNDANKSVMTVPVMVTNVEAGSENLHQLVYKITPGWTVVLAGHPDCTAADFSVGGEAVGASHTVVYDNDLPPASSAPLNKVTHTVTLQMIDNGLNQMACRGVNVSLTVLAS